MRKLALIILNICVSLLILTFTIKNAISQNQEHDSPSSKQTQNSVYQKAKQLANQSTVSIVGGGLSGTPTKFADDMAVVLNSEGQDGLRILPIIGLGGANNLKDILFLRGIDMSITQTDHIAYLKRKDPLLYANINQHVRYVAKLYNTEWHVLARKDIKSIKDLEGKTVNLWQKESTTGIGGETIFDILDINVKKIYIDTPEAIEKVKSGEIAATTLLTGAPSPQFKSIKVSDNLHFVPINEATSGQAAYNKLLDSLLPAQLKSEHYPNLIPAGTSLPTVASGAILAVYNWPEDSDRYRKLAIFVEKLFSNIENFRNSARHEKWKEINLATEVSGWTRFKPATLALQKITGNLSQPENNDRDFTEFLKKNPDKKVNLSSLTDEQRGKLYKQFLEWMQNK